MARPIDIVFRVSGLKELGEKFGRLSATMQNRVAGEATGAAAGLVDNAAKANLRASPAIESGLLQENVIVKRLSRAQTSVTSEHIVTVKKTPYPDGKRNTRQVALYVEQGTIFMAAEPFLRPAMDHNFNTATNLIKSTLASGIGKVVR